MFFGFSDEEKMLRKSVRDMFKEKNTIEQVREFMEDQTIRKELQKLLAEQGLLGIIDFNGSKDVGKGMVYGILVAQEAGRFLLTYPLIENIIGIAALKTCEKQQTLASEIETGQKVLTIAWVNVNGKAYKTENGYMINGALREVPFAQDADFILANIQVAGNGRTPIEEETLVVLDRKSEHLSIRCAHSIDHTYPLYDIHLFNYPLKEEAVVKRIGMGSGNELMAQMKQFATLLLSAEMVGIAERVLYDTVEYTKQRTQFGKLIGSFQALKHMAADMYVKVESGKAAVEYAAWAIDSNQDDDDIAVSIAKSYISSAAVDVCGDAIQMHGGIGYTWENDMHLFFKRARRSAALLGDSYHHREKLAKKVIDEESVQKEQVEQKHFVEV